MKNILKHIERLRDYLNNETELYKIIIKFEEEKRNSIISNDITYLIKITQKESLILDKLNKLEKARTYAVEELREKYFPNSKELKLIDIIKRYKKYGKELYLASTKLQRVLSNLYTLNNINKRLINDHISLINLSINALSKKEENQVYTPQGREVLKNENVLYNLTA